MRKVHPLNAFLWIASGVTAIIFAIVVWVLILSGNSTVLIPTYPGDGTTQQVTTTDKKITTTTTVQKTQSSTPTQATQQVTTPTQETSTTPPPATEQPNVLQEVIDPLVDGVNKLITLKIGG